MARLGKLYSGCDIPHKEPGCSLPAPFVHDAAFCVASLKQRIGVALSAGSVAYCVPRSTAEYNFLPQLRRFDTCRQPTHPATYLNPLDCRFDKVQRRHLKWKHQVPIIPECGFSETRAIPCAHEAGLQAPQQIASTMRQPSFRRGCPSHECGVLFAMFRSIPFVLSHMEAICAPPRKVRT